MEGQLLLYQTNDPPLSEVLFNLPSESDFFGSSVIYQCIAGV